MTSVRTLAANLEEEKLIHALASRGLVSREEYRHFRHVDAAGKAFFLEDVLRDLVASSLLTAAQAKRLAPELPALMNQHVPGYQVLAKLGQGSMGTVFKARQLSMDRLVALKILHPRLAANPDFLKRFVQEAHLAARFSSNHVVQAIDVGSAGSLHYFVMEYVEGATVKDELDRGKVFGEKEAVEIVLQVAQALWHAHRRSLIHRDVKPSNIILTADGIAKLADLGLARDVTGQEAVKAEKDTATGTPFYMAPEQIRGRDDIDCRADVYSLGATFYHMVTGRPPFPRDNAGDMLRAHLEEPLTPPDQLVAELSSGLREVVELMMAKQREDRYPSPQELILDLECLLREESPRLARRKIDTLMLAGLVDGEEDRVGVPRVPAWWLVVVIGILALSLLANIFLMLR